jgi:hypothetical protein
MTATNYKGSRDVQVPLGCNPNGSRHDTWPKGQKWWCNTKTDSRCPIVSMISVNLEWIYTWDQFHWKEYFLTFPRSQRKPQLDVICDLVINFNVDNYRTSWVLDIEIVSAILTESDFSCIWEKFHWKGYLVLFSWICRTLKEELVCILSLNLNSRWS